MLACSPEAEEFNHRKLSKASRASAWKKQGQMIITKSLYLDSGVARVKLARTCHEQIVPCDVGTNKHFLNLTHRQRGSKVTNRNYSCTGRSEPPGR